MKKPARENQELIQTILDSSPMMVALRDTDGKFLLINERYEEVHGVAKEDVIGKTLHELVSKEEAERYSRGDADVITTRKVTLSEEVIQRNGRELVLSVTKFPIVDSSGNVTGVGIIDMDVTESRQSEKALTREKQILDMTLESIDQGISMFDADLRLTAFNEKFLELLDLPAVLIKVGTSLEEAFRYNAERGDYGPGDVEEQVRERLELARRFEPHQFERTRPDGTVLEIRGRPTADGGFVTTYTDITERRLAERRIEETETQMRLALETLPGGLVYTDADLNVVVCNERFADMHDTPKELLAAGRPYEDFLRYLAEHGYYGEGDPDVFVAQRLEVIRDPSDTTVDHKTPDGRIHEIRRRKVPGGGTVTVVTDVTEEKQASEEISMQARMLREMSTPVTEIRRGTLLLPLVGLMDSTRAQHVLNAVLEKIPATRAKMLILDISGVPVIDSTVANHLIQITRGTRLMGCGCVISGVSSAIAQTIVELGIDIEDIETTANLAQAIMDRDPSFSS